MLPLSRREFLVSSIATLAAGCSSRLIQGMAADQTEDIRHLIILYTNDEHGWMEPYKETYGAAGIARLWREREHLTPNSHFLVLSGGDMWTGPALSTALRGESMAEVMNIMGYQAAAIGNHDFDFGLDALRDHLTQSDFPFLSANIRERDGGAIPDFATPFVVLEVNGVKVGLIGLTTTETKIDTKPEAVAGLEFLPYRDVVPTYAVQARDAGAELLILLTHVCAAETRDLAPLAAELGISIITGGHCHEEINEVIEGVQLVESGFFMRGYMRMELLFDRRTLEIIELETELVRNTSRRRDSEVLELMETWHGQADPGLWEVIGYSDTQIDRKSPEMAALLLTSWLEAWPRADVAIASPRYVQQDLYPGDITVGTIWGLLSTTNELVEIELTGAQLLNTIQARRPLIVGVSRDGETLLASGEAIDPDGSYVALVPDAIFAGGNYYEFYKFDPNPTYTGIDWRQPPIEWIRSSGSTRRQPISAFLEQADP